MPDWNPAEIIGENPENLSFSLYKKLVTDKHCLLQERKWVIQIFLVAKTND